MNSRRYIPDIPNRVVREVVVTLEHRILVACAPERSSDAEFIAGALEGLRQRKAHDRTTVFVSARMDDEE